MCNLETYVLRRERRQSLSADRSLTSEGTKHGCGHYIKVLSIPNATPMLRSSMTIIDPDNPEDRLWQQSMSSFNPTSY